MGNFISEDPGNLEPLNELLSKYNEMAETVHRNIINLHRKIIESLANEKYCDVTIKVGEQSFKCHSLILGSASKYFDALFKESKSVDIELKESELATFEAVLSFIYVGYVEVTESNVLALIRASEFYKLSNLKELCYKFLEEKMKVDVFIENALDVFTYIYRAPTQDDDDFKFVETLSAYIRKHLYYFLNTPSFLNIHFDELKTILEQPAPSKNENEFIHAIIRWLQQSKHSKDVEGELLNDLLGKVNYENMSPEFMKFIVEQNVRELTASKKSGTTNSAEEDAKNDDVLTADSSSVSEVGRMQVVNSLIPQSLYVYIKTPEKVTNVFTLQKYTSGFDWMFVRKANDNSNFMRITSLADHLYSLNYDKTQASSSSVQTFSISSSVSLFDKSCLKAPPLVVKRFDMDGINNWLYMYNKDIFSNVVQSFKDSEFSDEAISRGVYAYNCEIDKWMSLPPLLQKLADACMTYNHHSGLLYLIGGNDPTRDKLHGYVQAYDPRCESWMAIDPSDDFYENGVCCSSDVHKKSYVSGGLLRPDTPEMFCPVAGKWSRMNAGADAVEGCYRLISHGKNEWAFGEIVSDSSVEVYCDNGPKRSWTRVSSLSEAVKKNNSVEEHSESFSYIRDCVTFKPHGL